MGHIFDGMTHAQRIHVGTMCYEAGNLAVVEERKQVAAAICRECASGDVPTYDEAANYFYHNAGDHGEIGCTASAIHQRSRNAK